MVKPTRFEEIPTFVKSVTVLEPRGNVAAEVAAAVGPLAQSAVGGQMLVYGGLGVFSGFLTNRLNDVFGAFFKPLGLNIEVHYVDLARELSGLAFGAALVGGFAYFFRFHRRQLVILPFVLAGWFLGMQTVILGSPSHTSVDSQQVARCTDSEDSVECLKYKLSRAEEKEATQQDFFAWLGAGAIGAGVTAIGVPIATRRIFSFASVLSTTLAGAVIAVMWFAIVWLTNPSGSDGVFTCLFVAWQAVVAAFIGRLIR